VSIIEGTGIADRPRRARAARALIWTIAGVTLATGLALAWFASWQRPFLDGQRAAAAGDWTQALERYAAAETRFNQWPIAQRLFPGTYRTAVSNQLAAQFRLGNLDAVLEKAEVAPVTAATHFWTGSALFAKSQGEQTAEARLGWIGRASDEFKAALELEPDSWDVIYNYELTKRLFDELKKKPKTPPKQLLELLRPQPKEGPRPVKKAG
jgi:tetratricopeptide (TPR) repeat protein